jgi:serine/threonine-protein kinase
VASETVTAGQVIAGRYRVERQLGEGGMGSVFLVQHVHTDEALALKVLHAAVVKDAIALERFQREARTPARIHSDHVVRVTDADVAPELGGVPFLVMEYLRGHDLDKYLTARGRLPPQEVVLLLRQTARALDKAHALGIIHRDLKPENLFLTEREDGTPHIKLLDFGIAKLISAAGDLSRKGAATSTGQIFGTPLFMAPEQALAESARISPQTDIWALGLIAHKLLTGQDIWTATTLTHLVAQIAYEPMPLPSARGCTLGKLYDEWFAVCCARPAEARFASAGQAVAQLARALGIAEVSTTGRLVDSGNLSLDDSGRMRLTDPQSAFAATGDIRTSQGIAALKQSAGPLTRTDLRMASAPPRRRTTRLLLAGASMGIGIGGAIMIWQMSAAAPPAPAAPMGGPAPSATMSEPAPSALVTVAPAVEPTAAEPVATAEPTASATSVAAPPRNTGRLPTAVAKPPPATPKSTGAAAAAPSSKPTAQPIDPLSGRQ